jgi:hypothetical protein
MEEQVERKTKDRSPNFPFVSLEVAVDRAKAFYDEERKGAAPVMRAGMHWKYSPSSSGLIQTVAALKSYGLVVDEGSGPDRRLKLTELALRILLDTRPDSTERREMLRRAALSPNVSSEVHANWPDGLPSDETLNHHLVLERSFAPQNALRAVRILKENQGFAKLGRDVTLSASSTSTLDSESNEEDDNSDGHAITSDASPTATSGTYSTQQDRVSKKQPFGWLRDIASDKQRSSQFVEQVLDPDGQAIRIEFAAAPNEEMYEFLKDYIELRLKAMRRKASVQITGHAPTVIQTSSAPPPSDSKSAGDLGLT